MKKTDDEILSLTIEDIEKEVRDEFFKKQVRKRVKRISSYSISKLIQKDSVNDVINRLNSRKEEVAKKFGVSSSIIQMDWVHDYGGGLLVFSVYRDETDEQFEKRIQRKIKLDWTDWKFQKEMIERRKRRKKELAAQEQENAIKAIEVLSGDIYEIFQEINKRNNEKNVIR